MKSKTTRKNKTQSRSMRTSQQTLLSTRSRIHLTKSHLVKMPILQNHCQNSLQWIGIYRLSQIQYTSIQLISATSPNLPKHQRTDASQMSIRFPLTTSKPSASMCSIFSPLRIKVSHTRQNPTLSTIQSRNTEAS